MSKTFSEKLDEILNEVSNDSILVKAENSVTGYDICCRPIFTRTKQAIIDLVCEVVENTRTDNAWTVDTDLYYGFGEGADEFKRKLINKLKEN